jgi:hypothetical protein
MACGSCGNSVESEGKENHKMPKVDKAKFDDLLRRMLKAKPTPKSKIETSRKTKVGKVIPAR